MNGGEQPLAAVAESVPMTVLKPALKRVATAPSDQQPRIVRQQVTRAFHTFSRVLFTLISVSGSSTRISFPSTNRHFGAGKSAPITPVTEMSDKNGSKFR